MSAANIPTPQAEQRAMPVYRVRVPADTNNYATATNSAATVTLAVVNPNTTHKIEGLMVSYGGTPTGGGVTVTDSLINNGSSATIFSVDITQSGPIWIPLGWIGSTPGASLTITLSAGGSGVVGKLNVVGHKLESN